MTPGVSWSAGLYYHEVMPNLLCGSQPRNVDDIQQLRDDVGTTVIINVRISCNSPLGALATKRI